MSTLYKACVTNIESESASKGLTAKTCSIILGDNYSLCLMLLSWCGNLKRSINKLYLIYVSIYHATLYLILCLAYMLMFLSWSGSLKRSLFARFLAHSTVTLIFTAPCLLFISQQQPSAQFTDATAPQAA